MTPKLEQSEKLIADPGRLGRDAEELLQDLSPAAEEPARSRGEEVTFWILISVALALSFFAGYLLWAKATFSWPLQ
jgi:hypothetical protein